jgi:fructose-1,6-bisphosphatase/inositol monophosphatase family enzyme
VTTECGVHAWDIAAVIPIIQEAGGRFSDPDALASNGKLHDPVLAILSPNTTG